MDCRFEQVVDAWTGAVFYYCIDCLGSLCFAGFVQPRRGGMLIIMWVKKNEGMLYK
jgi:hypothetical protein